tara:strand:+ start:39820 stop:40278 length:459 start_codon:yes stop_codon:yes gene_type:complete
MHERSLLNYAYSLTGNKEQAEEIVQSAFIKLWKENFLSIQDYVVPWLYRVCRNEAIDYFRKGQKMEEFDEQKNNTLSEFFFFEDKIEKNIIFKIISGFSAEHQEVFILKFQEGYNNREISQITGLSSSNVGIILFRGIKKIQELLKLEVEDV